jgi:membrane associated rhomboid family serine protease
MRITLALIIINVAVFIAELIFGDAFVKMFSLTPSVALHGAWWQFITYMFLHADPLHIFLNMFALFMFGVVMERALGWKKYLFLYMVSGIASAFFYIFLTGIFLPSEADVLMLGASGAVYGILTAFGFMFPKEVIYVYFIPLPAISAVFILAAVELIFGVGNLMPGIANFGHLGGIITSAIIMLAWKHTSRPRTEKEMREYRFYWE